MERGTQRVAEVAHDTTYRYTQTVTLAHHLAHLQPRQDEGQYLEAFDLSIVPSFDGPSPMGLVNDDAFGNRVHRWAIRQDHQHLQVRSTSRVLISDRLGEGPPGKSLAGGLTVAQLAERLTFRHHSQGPFEAVFAQASPHVPVLDDLRRWAASDLHPHRLASEAAFALMERLHDDFDYRSQSTQVDTPLRDVVNQRAGVCQDFAHVLIGALRAHGLAARYVSGYLLPQAAVPQNGATHTAGAPKSEPLVGTGASHAWVQVWCPGCRGSTCGDDWLDLDPTNRLSPRLDHLRVAVGRDFSDVTPLRGVIRGGGLQQLSVSVHTRVMDID